LVLLFAILAMFLFGFIDYVGYNTVRPNWFYRVLQNIINIGICVGLYFISGIWCTILYIILYETFCADFVYYLFYDMLKWYGGDYAGHAFKSDVLGNSVTWAWWTPYGLVKRFLVGKKYVPISGEILIEQAQFGIAIVIAIGLSIFIFHLYN